MAINTATRRASVQATALGMSNPVPDGTIAEGDRAHRCFLYSGLDYQGAVTGTLGGVLTPPKGGDPRIIQFFIEQSIVPTRGIDYEFRLALALDIGVTEAAALVLSCDDMWLLYKETKGITDESAPFLFPVA
jgi:hypothetical protein